MNPELDMTPGLGLPQPSTEIGQAPSGYAPERVRRPEVSAPRFESMGSPQQAPATSTPQPFPTIPQSQQPMSAPIASVVITQDNIVQGDSTDDKALDAEWVHKAKEMVERTHTDPYLQSKELSRIKAEYIKVRYSKEIKVSEEP